MASREFLALQPLPHPILLALSLVFFLLTFSHHNPFSNFSSSTLSTCYSCRRRPNWAIAVSPLLIVFSVHYLSSSSSSSEASVLDAVSAAAKMGSAKVPWGLAAFVGLFLLVAVFRLRRLFLLLLRLVYLVYLPFRDVLVLLLPVFCRLFL